MPQEIRLLNESDAEGFRTLRLQSLLNDSLAWTSSYEEEINLPIFSFSQKLRSATSSPVFGYYGVFENEKLIAYAQLSSHYYLKKAHVATLFDVLVSEKYRNKSVGSTLLKFIFVKVKSTGSIEQIELKVLSTNKKAIIFYEKMGFKNVAILPKAVKEKDGGYQDELVYILDLKP